MNTIHHSARLTLCALLIVHARAADPIILHVAPSGNDTWSGRIALPAADRSDGPLASLAGARDAVRKIKTPDTPVRVRFADGLYRLDRPVDFITADSGTARAPVVYEAAPGAKPVFSGGIEITGWKPGPGGVWTTSIPQAGGGKWSFEQLWINGRRATRARTPNKFYHHMARPVADGVDPLTGQQADLSARAIAGRGHDLDPVFDLPKDQLADVTAVVYHSWEMSRHRIAAADRERNQLVTTAPAPWPFFKWGADQRYHLENFRAALDAPGEWFLSRDGTLSYLPMPDEDLTRARVIAPVTDRFVRFSGGPSGPVEHVMLKGLAFEYAGYLLPPQGHGDAQAAHAIEAVIMADGARNLVIEDCEIAHTGIYGVWFRRACLDCRVVRSHLHDLGAGGVRIGQGWDNENPSEADRTGRCVVDNTIVYNTKTGGFHQHYGRENVIRNNIFAFAREHQIQRSRKEDHLSFTFSNNIVLWDSGKLLDGQWRDPNVIMKRNLYWRADGQPFDFAGLPFDQWRQTGQDDNSVIANPEFVDAGQRDFRLNRGNAALAGIGFKPFDFTRAGVYGADSWRALAASRRYPALEIPPPAPPPPPLALSLDFEAPAAKPLGPAILYQENKGDAVAVTGDTAATGKCSLRVTDAPGLQARFNPHFHFQPHHRDGITTCSFDLNLGPGAEFHHEWRDAAAPYRTGPGIFVNKGVLTAAGRQLATLPTNQWVHIEVTAGLGAASTATWNLAITLPGQAPQRFDKLPCDPLWKQLEWLGFVSNTDSATVFHLDNLTLGNKP